MTEPTKVFPHTPYAPYDATASAFKVEGWVGDPYAHPLEYSGWRSEQMSWKESAYLCSILNPTPTSRLTGPDVIEFLRSVSVNSLTNFRAGQSRHLIMTDREGRINAHGMVVHEFDGSFITYWLDPWLQYCVDRSTGFDVTNVDITPDGFLFQIGGPRSLEILEEAAGENLRDIAFLRHRPVTIAGHELRLLRIGMAGTLGYELHGPLDVAIEVYDAVFAAGEPIGIKKLGLTTYMSNHTENGFAQSSYHFPSPWVEDPDVVQWFADNGLYDGEGTIYDGSETDMSRRYRNPYDLGWGNLVKFDHDFLGRDALEAIATNHNDMRTLVWNADDVAEVFRSQFGGGEEYTQMDMPIHQLHKAGDPHGAANMWADKVFVGDHQIGTSSGRAYAVYSKEMLSLATLEPEYLDIGTEVEVLWGNPGTPQKRIRARVARYPYLIDPPRNEVFDVNSIPERFPAK